MIAVLTTCAMALTAIAHPDDARDPDSVIWLAPSAIPDGVEEITDRAGPGEPRDRYAAGAIQPRLLVYRPERPNGAALLILPGGGYQRVVIDKEGLESAERFSDAGFTAFVLLYRLPDPGVPGGVTRPLEDAQAAMRVIRAGAAERGLDPGRIGVLGFSAGGHLAGSLALAPAGAPSTGESAARPDFAILAYPVTRMTGPHVHAGSRDRLLGPGAHATALAAWDLPAAASPDDPPVFLFHAEDDTAVPPENALDLHQALRAQGAPTALHVFAEGGHGFGIRRAAGLPASVWPDLVMDWIGVVAPPAPRPDDFD